MPTYYYIDTTNEAKAIVDSSDIEKIDLYVNPNKDTEMSEEAEKKLYHITSYATEISHNEILAYVLPIVDFSYKPDGNCYNLIYLALENYLVCYNDEHDIKKPEEKTLFEKYIREQNIEKFAIFSNDRFQTLKLLLQHAKDTDQNEILGHASRQLISHIDKYDDWTLLDIFVNEHNICLWDVYHYSIAWNYKNVFCGIVDKYKDKINFDWNESAFDIAIRFEHNDMPIFVKNYLTNLK